VGPDNRRMLLAAVLSTAILAIWMWLNPVKPPPAQKPVAAAPAEPAASPAPAPAAPGALPAAAPVPVGPEETVVLETAEFRATFTSHGGALKGFLLKNAKFLREEKGKTEPIDLVRVAAGSPHPYAVAAGPELGGPTRPDEDPAARGSMRIAARDERSVTFEGMAGAARIVKTFTVGKQPFEIALRLRAEADRAGSVQLLATGFLPPDAPTPSFFSGGAYFDFVRPICRAGDATERFTSDKADEKVKGEVVWGGLEQHYFVNVAVAEKPVGECTFLRGPAKGALATAIRLPFDRTLDARFTLFVGPKQADLLKAYGKKLEDAIDYGPMARYFAFFGDILMKLLGWFAGYVHNWGLAIVLLTLTVKAVLFPLTLKSMRSMAEMRKLQPEIEKLREKHKDDKEQLNLAVMKMYQEHKVNPLGGCLPLLLQMPVFFALWGALATSVELYREPFLWIADLSSHDPIYVLPLITGATMFVMQKLSPQPADSTQAKMMLYFMPIFFTFFMWKLPAGLALYSVVNNVVSSVQQQALMRTTGGAKADGGGKS